MKWYTLRALLLFGVSFGTTLWACGVFVLFVWWWL